MRTEVVLWMLWLVPFALAALMVLGLVAAAVLLLGLGLGLHQGEKWGISVFSISKYVCVLYVLIGLVGLVFMCLVCLL